MSKKIFLSPERRPAPHGKYAIGSVYEHDYCNEMGQLVKNRLEHNDFAVTLKTKDEGANTMRNRVQEANAGDYDYYACIHTNAYNGKASGTLMCAYNHPASWRANEYIYDRLIKLLPSNRGVQDYSEFYENRNAKMVSSYTEIAFHDNPADAKFLLENKEKIADAIAGGICDYFAVEYKPLDEKPIQEEVWHKNQLGAFRNKEGAEKQAEELKKLGYEPWTITV